MGGLRDGRARGCIFMSTPTKLAAHDLATLKIEEPLRAAGKAGRRLGLFAAGPGGLGGIGGFVVVLVSQHAPAWGSAAPPGGGPPGSGLPNCRGLETPTPRM